MRLLFIFLVTIGRVSAIGEGVLDVDALMGMFSGVANMFQTIKTVDAETDKMLGTWYQMYKAAINFDVFRTNMFCPVAYLSRNSVMGSDGFSILEAYRVISKSGPIETYKRDVTKTDKGIFWMYTEEYFYPRQLSIIKTFPEAGTSNDTYEYMVATDANRLALMVLARNPIEFYDKFNDDVLEFLKENGFGGKVFWNSPKAIYQGSDCNWPSEREAFARRVLKNHAKKLRGSQNSVQETQFQSQSQPQSLNPIQTIQGIFSGLQSFGKK